MSAIITLTCVFHHLHAVIHVLAHMYAITDGIADPGFSRQVLPTTKWGVDLLLPSATKLRRLCFYKCLSFCPQGGVSALVHALIPPTPGSRHPPGAGHSPWEQTSPPRRLLLWTVRILLECILVPLIFCLKNGSKFCETMGTGNA